jgi:hypothetical protein
MRVEPVEPASLISNKIFVRLHRMQFEIASFALGVLMGSLIAVAIAIPRAGRIFSRIVSVIFFAAGAGLLTWAIVAIVSGAEFRPIAWESFRIGEPVEALGLGGGLFLGGILALVLSFIGKSDQQS